MNQANQTNAYDKALKKRSVLLEILMAAFIVASVFLSSVPQNSLSAELGEGYAAILILATIAFSIIATAFFAYLLYFSKTPAVLLLIPIAFFLSYFATNSFYTSLSSLWIFLPGLGIYLGLRKKCERNGVIIRAAAIFGAGLFIYFLITVFYAYGEFSFDAIRDFFEGVRLELKEQLLEASAGIEGYTAEIINLYVNFTMIIIPGIFITFCNIFSYLLLCVFEKAVILFDKASEIPPQAKVFSMSLTSAIIYIVSAFIITFISLFSEHYSIFALLVINFVIILMPGHFSIGVRSLKYQIKNPFTKRSAWIWIIITGFVAFLFGFIYVFLFVALYGAWETISFALAKKAIDKFTNNGDSNN